MNKCERKSFANTPFTRGRNMDPYTQQWPAYAPGEGAYYQQQQQQYPVSTYTPGFRQPVYERGMAPQYNNAMRQPPPPPPPSDYYRQQQPVMQPYAPGDYTDPYSHINPRNVNYDEYETYVRPLQERETLHRSEELEIPGDLPGLTDNQLRAKKSPVNVRGLTTINTKDVTQPSSNPEEIKRMREAEERMFRIPSASPESMKPIDTHLDTKVNVNDLKKMRNEDLRGITVTEPPPGSIQCGWREYQGGATWKDISRFRDFELGHLKEQQKQQAGKTDVEYYY